MAAFFIVEEGPLSGLIVRFEEGHEWVLGRDPESVYQVLEDPMVSRKHVILRQVDEGYLIENLSAVNPALVNGKPIAEPLLLQEGDMLQIGGVLLRYTEVDPVGEGNRPQDEESEALSTPTVFDEEGELDHFQFMGEGAGRWMLKVIAGPNSGAEFSVDAGETYVLGKDPAACDIAFHDLSVSRQHAKVFLGEDGKVHVEDMGSKNGVVVNGVVIEGSEALDSQDVFALGTTALIVIDREQSRETIVAAPSTLGKKAAVSVEKVSTGWKETLIPRRHLLLAGLFVILLLVGLGGLVSLFTSSKVEIAEHDNSHKITEIVSRFPTVEYNLTASTGRIFLVGHVITEIEHQELNYMIRALPFIRSVEDTVIIDELVWENFNALLIRNPNWRGVSVTSSSPGRFVLRGYVDTAEELNNLGEFITINFPYTDHLNNEVVVEKTLNSEVQALLLEKGFVNVTFQLSGGELLLAGRVPSDQQRRFGDAMNVLRSLKGIKQVRSFVLMTSGEASTIDLTGKYAVTGTSKLGNIPQYVVIDGKILASGDRLDEMMITKIDMQSIFLEKDGLKFRINYNQP